VATGASYSHYSLPLERIGVMEKRAKKNYRKQVRIMKKLEKILSKYSWLFKLGIGIFMVLWAMQGYTFFYPIFGLSF
jgi:hypothetical protein